MIGGSFHSPTEGKYIPFGMFCSPAMPVAYAQFSLGAPKHLTAFLLIFCMPYGMQNIFLSNFGDFAEKFRPVTDSV